MLHYFEIIFLFCVISVFSFHHFEICNFLFRIFSVNLFHDTFELSFSIASFFQNIPLFLFFNSFIPVLFHSIIIYYLF